MKKISNKMTFWEHIDELRYRIISVFFIVLLATILSYFFIDSILELIRAPIIDIVKSNPNIKEAFKSIASPFFLSISTSLYSGVFIAFPFILYNMLRFIFPAMNKRRFLFLSIIIFFSVTLFLIGVFLAYKIIFPISLSFLATFLPSSGDVPLFIFVNEYVSLIFSTTMFIGLVFQLPIISLFLSRLKLINSKTLSGKRKYAILLSFIFSAIITPPDVISQIILSIPILILYEISIIIAKFSNND